MARPELFKSTPNNNSTTIFLVSQRWFIVSSLSDLFQSLGSSLFTGIGGVAPQNVPQMVLLTFDDSVNDLNKELYQELFERGRTNPNGCPISATFYVSHEWTDYSQVQNLYADGHEIASHSIT